ncbi:hypothetical protein K435DRAFT_971415 [Dendrothele bispora CBS 962.96]|uniref:Uncharacterized protein n=1 Tax=Dendrothele bispora (strain CBS 962.96) TaxID=1314807 RepID=A0A4V4HCM2_DENBC|nr:hypothetical protein K435DRAFT_971415 [Dendrothele bispora CBS 962.96]
MTEDCKQLFEDFLDINSAATYPTVSPAMIEFVNKQFWPQMLAKCDAIRRHYTLWFDYTNNDTDIYHSLSLSPRLLGVQNEIIQARIAVCCIAAEDGILGFLEHRGLTSGSHSPLALGAAPAAGLTGDAAKLNDEVEEGELREDDDMSSGSLSSYHSSSHTRS